MPVQLPPQYNFKPTASAGASRSSDGDIRAAIAAILRPALLCEAAGVLLLWAGMRALRPALIAAEKLMHVGSSHWWDSIMPIVLFSIFGLVFGVTTAWRVSSAASLGRPATWLAVGASILLLVASGAAMAEAMFVPAVPTTCWASLVCMGLATAAGMYFLTIWLE